MVVEAEDTCMTLRGAQATGSRTVASTLLDSLRQDTRSRQEFFALTGVNGQHARGRKSLGRNDPHVIEAAALVPLPDSSKAGGPPVTQRGGWSAASPHRRGGSTAPGSGPPCRCSRPWC